MLLTVCPIAQLPQAFALGESFHRHHPGVPFVIGLADDPARLPAGVTSPYPLLGIDCVAGDVLSLSVQYTPTEFVAACKPSFIRAALAQYPDQPSLLYLDPTGYVYQPLQPVYDRLLTGNLLLTPHLIRPPKDDRHPDEKHLQNIGLYASGFLGFRRSAETDRMLAWWQQRVTERAFIDYCEGYCADQIWLMHVPVFFEGVMIAKEPTWHVGLWNLHERPLTLSPNGPVITGQGPVLFANFRGLTNPDEGYFVQQDRTDAARQPALKSWLAAYQTALRPHRHAALDTQRPAYGQRPEPVILRGWRRSMVQTLRQVTTYVDTMPLPVIR